MLTRKGLTTHTQELKLNDEHKENRSRARRSAVREAVYAKLANDTQTVANIDTLIPRTKLLNTIKALITPRSRIQTKYYPVIIGEHGTGKTSLIKLVMSSMEESKGVVYVDCPIRKSKPVYLAQE